MKTRSAAQATAGLTAKQVTEIRDPLTAAEAAGERAVVTGTLAAPLLLSPEEGAAQLRIGRSRMFDLIRRGEVLSVKVGGSRRIPYDSLRAYVNRLVTEQGTPGGNLPAA
jgi:excisionase family DNA binding protein